MNTELYLGNNRNIYFRLKFGLAILINTYIRLKIRVGWGEFKILRKGFVILKNRLTYDNLDLRSYGQLLPLILMLSSLITLL